MTMAEQRSALLEQASEKLREAAQALEGISGLVPDVVYLDWDRKSTGKLPLGYTRVLLDTIADALDKRAKRG